MVSYILRISTVFIILLTLFSTGEQREKGSLGIFDDRGIPLLLESPPKRIISLVPSITEILYALKGEGFLVGVTTYCDFPREAQELPKMGDLVAPSLERILDQKPDLIFATLPLQSSIVERLEGLGLVVFVLQPESVGSIKSSIRKVGQMMGREREAEILLEGMDADLVRMEERIKEIKQKKRVYLEIGVNPLMSVGKRSFVGELIERAGGINIVEGNDPYPIVNPERVIQENPEVILIAHSGTTKEEVMGRLGWGGLQAVREGRVSVVRDPDMILRPGPRIAEGLDLLFHQIYPDEIISRYSDIHQ